MVDYTFIVPVTNFEPFEKKFVLRGTDFTQNVCKSSVPAQCQAQTFSQKATFKRSKIGHRYDEAQYPDQLSVLKMENSKL